VLFALEEAVLARTKQPFLLREMRAETLLLLMFWWQMEAKAAEFSRQQVWVAQAETEQLLPEILAAEMAEAAATDHL
jgi:hypothetical protein